MNIAQAAGGAGGAAGGAAAGVTGASGLRLRLHLSENMHFLQSPSHSFSSDLYLGFDRIGGPFRFSSGGILYPTSYHHYPFFWVQ
jgi:hypothetical protein